MARRRGLKRHRFDHVRTLLRRQRANQRDIYAPLSRIELHVDDALGPVHRRYRVRVRDGGASRSMRLTPTALGQLASIAGVPQPFLERVPPPLGLRVMRCMLDVSAGDEDPTFLMRLREEGTPKVRALLPASFVRIHDEELLNDVSNVVDRPAEITDVYINDDVFSLRMVFPDEVADLGSARSPDPAMPGLDLRSSETGAFPLQIRRLVFREICSNGMTAVAESQRVLRQRMTRFDRVVFRGAVEQAMDEAIRIGTQTLGRLRASRSEMLDDPAPEIGRVFRRYRLGSPHGERARWVAGELVKGSSLFGVSRFELIQAFTAVARGLEHDRRLQWEDAMADYLINTPSTH